MSESEEWGISVRRSGIRGEDDGGSLNEGHETAGRPGPDAAAPVPGQRRAPDAGAPAAPGGAGPDPAGDPGPGSRRKAQRKRKKPKPRWRRILVWTAGSLAVLIAAVAVAGYLYLEHLNDNITKRDRSAGGSDLAPPEPNANGETPLNILLLGSDSRDGEENSELGGASDLAGGPVRADVQMLLHASADRSNISLISIPRDTQVPIPECTDPDTGEVYPADESASINTALSHGGPGCVVDTWQDLTGVYIHHFMMVDFAGVVDMADAVGGVPVCVTDNVDDPKSGLRLEAGETTIEGEQALQWLRTRKGFEDGSDIGRTRAQQMYLSNMVEELQSSTSLTNTTELMGLAEAATSALTVNHEIGSVQDLYNLAGDLREVPNDRINMVTLPWLPDPAAPDVTIIPDPAKSEELFTMLRDDIPLDDPDARPADPEESGEPGGEGSESPEATPDAPAEVEVAVRNGTGGALQAPVSGRAGVITGELQRLGWTAAATDTTAASEEATALLYPDIADQANAEAVAEALGVPHGAVRASTAVDRVTLVIGADWREGVAYPASSADPTEDPARDEGPAVDEEDITSGKDGPDCMEVNPAYTW
ncbi:LCP family protein [Streptomyces johnsoniae]|uniref:LCP family protein n=1 Tax=Streptomyces johnsoniae TaxID=3075532 RepID=A0ABU2S0I2_9ACTN|nr:LCP family protein [Streptomyces sp. DSM 41886]MDT0441590.1 LCP family protein [Streptomyces sp. DSM 41886]